MFGWHAQPEDGCIAFCFLTRELPLQSELWYEFFLEADALGLPFVVVVHNKEPVTKACSPAHVARHWFKERVTRTVETEWGHLSLVRATMRLWEEAIGREPRVSHLCLLSESCVPLCGFRTVYNEVCCFERTTFDVRPSYENLDRFGMVADKTLMLPKHRKKQSQWFVALRRDADFFLANDSTTRWGEAAFAPDEHYFVTLMEARDRPYSHRPTTFSDWNATPRFPVDSRPGPSKRQAKPYVFDRVRATTITALRQEGFLFLRKVAAATAVELDLDPP